MSIHEILQAAQFVVDAKGNKKAVLVDYSLWEELFVGRSPRLERASLGGSETETTTREGEQTMGEVRVQVRLTNAVDQALLRRGLLPAEQVRTYEADALVDTGAVRCVLPPHVVQRLGLELIGQRVAEYADGRLEPVGLTEPFTLQVLDRDELETAMVLGDEVMIGQTALEKLDLFVDCVNRRLVPNPAHPDQPVSKVK